MYYFHLAPPKMKKYFFVQMDFSQKRCKTLLKYYIETYYHFIPKDVIFIDYYIENGNVDEYNIENIKQILKLKD